ncbi:FecCD family ABC transporter permease [Marinomonas gallaica]|uniref:FecCD family ABC transporter permease n=1 Tax=Marinomonas gallaica TaxID=1806667 RepID=UPI003CE48490
MAKQWVIRQRWGSFSVPYQALLALILITMVMLLVMWVSLCLGDTLIMPRDVLATFLSESSSEFAFVVEVLRLPRLLMAAMVGAALAVSGLVLQSMIRNPLASPDIIGITSGASAAAVTFLSLFAGLGMGWLPVFAIAGALVAALAIYVLAWRNGVTPMRLILVGIGVSAAMGAVTTLLIAVSSTATSITAYIWLTGSVYGSDWHDVRALAPWLLVSMPLTLCLARRINAQELGDQLATGLGISVQRLRLVLLGLSVLLAAPAVAYAGAVGFVGLIAPHIARRLVTRSFGLLMPATAMIGASLVMLADLIGRTLFQPLDIPAGVFVSAIGAPFFIFLLYRQRF